MNAPIKKAKAEFAWDDPLLLDQQLTQEERMVRDAAHDYAQGKLAPRVLEAFRNETTDPAIFREMGQLGMLGPTIAPEYGGPGLSYVAYGLIAREEGLRGLQPHGSQDMDLQFADRRRLRRLGQGRK